MGDDEAPARDKGELQGEIIISTVTAAANARRFATTAFYEIVLYIAHGILHLLGYDDHGPDARRRMRDKEREIMIVLKLMEA
jgi:probable rRNA maturation factor